MTPKSYRVLVAWIIRGLVAGLIAWGLVQLLLFMEPRQPSLRLGTTRGITLWQD